MYLPSGISPNHNPYGHATMSVTGNPSCTGGEIVERYDYLKADATSYKEVTVTKNYGAPAGIQSHTMSWSRVFDSQGPGGDGVLSATVPDRLRLRCDEPGERDELGRFREHAMAAAALTGVEREFQCGRASGGDDVPGIYGDSRVQCAAATDEDDGNNRRRSEDGHGVPVQRDG
jgi:hypothetical protein